MNSMRVVLAARRPLGVIALVLGTLSVFILQSATAAERPATSKSTPEALNLYSDAASYQNNKAYDLALEEWEKFLKQFPADPLSDKARHYAGVCELQLKHLEKAIAYFQPVVAKGAKFEFAEDSLLNLAWSQYSLGGAGKPELYAQAIESFSRLAKDFPKGKYLDQALFYRGESLYALGKKTEAVAAYREMMEQRPDSPLKCDALYSLGVALEELKNYADAASTYDRFLEGCGENELASEVRMRKADLVLAQGNAAEAEKMFAAIAAMPKVKDLDRALLRQAYCAAAQNAFPRAAELFARIPKEFPSSSLVAEASLSAGRCYYRAEQFAEAAKWLQPVAEGDGAGSPEAAHWLCKIQLRDKQPGKAAELAQRVLARGKSGDFQVQLQLDLADALYAQPEHRAESMAKYLEVTHGQPQHELAAQALYNAAFAARELKRFEEGLKLAEEFQKSYSASEFAPDAQYVAAECQLQLGRRDEAESTLQSLVSGHANHENIELYRIGLAWVLLAQKKYGPMNAELQGLLAKLKDNDRIAEVQLLLGRGRFQTDQFKESIESFSASLAASPKWLHADEALLYLARAKFKTGANAEAVEALKRLQTEFPQSELMDQVQYRLGEFAYGSNDFSAAVAAYDEMLSKWPESTFVPFALYGKGWSLLKLEKFAPAAEALSSLIAKYPQHELFAGSLLARAMCERHLKQYAEAIRDAEQFLGSNPKPVLRADALLERGMSEAGSENAAKAVQTFESILHDVPDYPQTANVLYELAWTYKKLNRDAESVAAFSRLAKDFGNTQFAAEANWRIGENHFDKGEYDQAVKLYTVAKEQAPPGEVGELATHKLGWAFYRLNDFDNAYKQFSSQIQAYPNGPLSQDALFMQGECLFKGGKHEQALPLFQKASKSNLAKPEMQVLALLHGAESAQQLGRWQDSVRMLDAIIEKQSDSPYVADAFCRRGLAKQNLKKADEAKTDFEEAANRSRGEAGAHARFLLGEILFDRKEYDEAIKTFRRVMFGFGADKVPPEVQHWQAMAGYEAGRCAEVQIEKAAEKPDKDRLATEAKEFFNYVVDRHPTHDLVGEAKQRIEALNKLK